MSFIINGNIYIKTPLLRSIDRNDMKSFKKQVEEGESMDEDNQIILLYIFYKKNLEFLRLYFFYKYNIKNGVIKNIFPFFYSFKNFLLYKDAFDILLYNGLDVNFLYEKHQYIDVEATNQEKNSWISEASENVSTSDRDRTRAQRALRLVIRKESLLINCCRDNQLYIVKKLLEFGADTEIRNIEGKTALDIAKEKKLTELVRLLEKYN